MVCDRAVRSDLLGRSLRLAWFQGLAVLALHERDRLEKEPLKSLICFSGHLRAWRTKEAVFYQ